MGVVKKSIEKVNHGIGGENMNWKLLFEYLKEPMRWLLIAIIAWVIDAIVPVMKPEYVPYVMIVLRFVDKWLHDIGGTIDSDTLKGGLTRF